MRKALDPSYTVGIPSLASKVTQRIRMTSRIEISDATAMLVFELFLSEIKMALYDGARVNIRNFGQIVPHDPAERFVPKYGVKKPKRVLKFIPTTEVSYRLNEEE